MYRGDFNEVLYIEERNRVVSRTRGMNDFCEFVDNNDLINLSISGARFIWSNFQERPSLSKLDRFLISLECDDLFDPVFVQALPRVGLDHIPIMLKGGDVLNRSGLIPFKFQNMWLLHSRFVKLVKNGGMVLSFKAPWAKGLGSNKRA